MRAPVKTVVSRIPRLFALRDVARAFGAHPQTVRRWVRAGILGGRKAGPRNHKVWVTEEDLRRFLDTRTGISRFPYAL